MTKYLLDTHVVLWLAENSPSLSIKAKNAIFDAAAEKYVSIVSAWEVAIKIASKKLYVDGGLPEFFKMLDDNGFGVLPVERKYVSRLPGLADHHKDPFDRLLVATAQEEDMIILTADENIRKYDVPSAW